MRKKIDKTRYRAESVGKCEGMRDGTQVREFENGQAEYGLQIKSIRGGGRWSGLKLHKDSKVRVGTILTILFRHFA